MKNPVRGAVPQTLGVGTGELEGYLHGGCGLWGVRSREAGLEKSGREKDLGWVISVRVSKALD